MTIPQFDTKVTSKDGRHLLFIRGPHEVEGGMAFEMRLVAVEEMGKCPVMWKEAMVDERHT